MCPAKHYTCPQKAVQNYNYIFIPTKVSSYFLACRLKKISRLELIRYKSTLCRAYPRCFKRKEAPKVNINRHTTIKQ